MDKSIFSISHFNANLFVLTFRGQKQGAVRELDYVLKNPEHVFKCIVFIETMRKGRSQVRCLSKMLEDDLRSVGMRVAEFTKGKDEELLGLTKGDAVGLSLLLHKKQTWGPQHLIAFLT